MQGNKFEKITTIKPHRGHTLFKVNKETLEITKADFTTLPMKGKKGVVKNKKVIIEDGFFYIPALNKRNVRKKLLKMVLEQKK